MEGQDRLQSHLLWLWENEKLLDVQLLCNNLPVASAHRVVLSAFSEYFAALFYRNNETSTLKPVEYVSFDDITAANIVSVIRFLYTGAMGGLETRTTDSLCSLLKDSEKLGVKGAVDFVKSYMQKNDISGDMNEDSVACVNITNSFDISGIDLNKSFDMESGSLPLVLQNRSLETELSISIKCPTPKQEISTRDNLESGSSDDNIFCRFCDIGTQTEEDILKEFTKDCNFSVHDSIVESSCEVSPERESQTGCNTPSLVNGLSDRKDTDTFSESQGSVATEDVVVSIVEEASADGTVTTYSTRTRRIEKEDLKSRSRSVKVQKDKTHDKLRRTKELYPVTEETKIKGRKSTLRKGKQIKDKTKRRKRAEVAMETATDDADSKISKDVGLCNNSDVGLRQEKEIKEKLFMKLNVRLEDGVAISSATTCSEVELKKEEGSDGEVGDNRGDEENETCDGKVKKTEHSNTRAKLKRKSLSKGFFAECKQEDGCYLCPVCSKPFTKEGTLRKHYRLSHSVDQSFTCTVSPKTFTDSSKLQEHTRAHTDEQQFMCPECGSCFKAKKHLTKHVKMHNKSERVPCSESGCQMTFTCAEQMDRHVRSKHLNLRPYKCPEEGCPYSAPDSSALKCHRQIHLPPSERPVNLCSICGAAVPGGSTNLKVHMVKHSNVYHSCHLCGYKTKYQMYLQSHITRRHGVDSKGESVEKKFKCPHCDFCCYFKHEFTFHMKKHNPEKPFKCKLCEYSTLTQSQLNAHIRTHTGAKPFTCKRCDKSFTQSTHLVRHMRTHTGEKPHKCDMCGEGFIEKRYLERHKYSAHLGYKPFMCHLCTYSCIKKDTLKNHIRLSHGEDALPPDMRSLNRTKILVSELPEEQQKSLIQEGNHWQPQLVIPPPRPSQDIVSEESSQPRQQNRKAAARKPGQGQAKVKLNTSQSRKERRRKQNSPMMWKEGAKLPPAYATLDLNSATISTMPQNACTTANNVNNMLLRPSDDHQEAIMKQLQFHQQLMKLNSSAGMDLSCSNPAILQPQRLLTPPPTFIGTGSGLENGDEDDAAAVAMVTNQPVQVRIQSGGTGSHHTISLQLPEYLTIPLHKAAASSLTELQSAAAVNNQSLMNSIQSLSGIDASLWSQGLYHTQS